MIFSIREKRLKNTLRKNRNNMTNNYGTLSGHNFYFTRCYCTNFLDQEKQATFSYGRL